MPSKYTTGNSPIGRRIRNKNSPVSGFAQVEREIGRVQSVPSLVSRSRQLPNGTLHLPPKVQSGSSAGACILGRIGVDSVNSTEQAPKKKLSVGFISGGGGSESVVIDNLTATIDGYVYIQVAWTGSSINGVLQAGGTMGAVTSSQGATAPNDTTPTASTPAGSVTIVLGQWLSDGADEPSPVWHNQGCGSIQLYFCPGNGFFFGRDNTVQQAIDI